MSKRIKVAREEGDLKENAEYHTAKEDQAHLETRIKRLRERLHNAVVVEAGDGDADSFAFGRTAEVLDREKVNTWTLVGSTEADLTDGPPLRRVADRAGAARRRARQRSRSRPPAGSKTFVVQKLLD